MIQYLALQGEGATGCLLAAGVASHHKEIHADPGPRPR